MPKNRLGTEFSGAAPAKVGSIASRSGSPSRTPVPRRKCRREIMPELQILTFFIGSFAPEEFTSNDTMDEGFHSVSIGLGAVQNGFYRRPVRKTYLRPG